MSIEDEDKKKQVIGLYGEMQLAMELHRRGWQVHRSYSYIDSGIDLVISKYYCKDCKKYSKQKIKNQLYKEKKRKCVTNLCSICERESLKIITKYLQIKTSEGISSGANREFSFHPKIRYNIDKIVYYVWIAVYLDNLEDIVNAKQYYYVFNSTDVEKFDDINIPTYQITDNQKTALIISRDGKVLNQGKKYKYDCFNDEFFNNFSILEQIL